MEEETKSKMIIEQRKARAADVHSLDYLPVSIFELQKDLNAILIKEDAQYHSDGTIDDLNANSESVCGIAHSCI